VTALTARDGPSLRTPLVWSALLHVGVVAALVVSRAPAHVPAPPTYRVNLVAAPPGPRQIGVVQPAPPEPVPAPAPAPAATPATPAPTPAAPTARETPEPERMKAPAKAKPVRTPKVATPNVGATTAKPVKPTKAEQARAQPVPRAGGGPTGGRGADVANVRTEGIDFPYPVYLQNVVRQIALQFKPANGGALRAEVAFLIRRDGSISGLKLVTRSGNFSFDQDAMGAVEAAARSFGPLPQGFTDDVLPVIFSFDPQLIR
jgi:periplasmic protein TonB